MLSMTITVNAETPATLKALLADLIPAIADSGAPLPQRRLHSVLGGRLL